MKIKTFILRLVQLRQLFLLALIHIKMLNIHILLKQLVITIIISINVLGGHINAVFNQVNRFQINGAMQKTGTIELNVLVIEQDISLNAMLLCNQLQDITVMLPSLNVFTVMEKFLFQNIIITVHQPTVRVILVHLLRVITITFIN